METTYFDDRTRTSTAAADRLCDEVRQATAAVARTDQLRSAARELPTPGVDVHGQQPWVAPTNPAGYQSARRTERPGRCSCGRRPVQWLDGPQGAARSFTADATVAVLDQLVTDLGRRQSTSAWTTGPS